ncbi:MAG: 7-cyano-7-deazaguanine synthase QueC [Chitinivibrionia bacterium]|nr:7-cyano-7-deazaguanine synthase QueC [Chitinivibrionia bacterium]
MKKAVVLLSGGLDSSTCAAIAKSEEFEIHAISFSYGQRHDIEIECAKKVAKFLQIKEHKIINIDTDIFRNSSLTANSITEIPKNREEIENEIPNTYVPARNTLFLSYALAFAESIGASDIFIGITAVDYSGYPDCRPDYIEAYQKMANLATKAAVEGNPIIIHTPLINLSKAEIIATGHKLQMNYALTHSCYSPSADGRACGACDSCIHRKKGFLQAKIPDPTKYIVIN